MQPAPQSIRRRWSLLLRRTLSQARRPQGHPRTRPHRSASWKKSRSSLRPPLPRRRWRNSRRRFGLRLGRVHRRDLWMLFQQNRGDDHRSSVLISAFNALTLSPALCAVFLRHPGPRRGLMGLISLGIDGVRGGRLKERSRPERSLAFMLWSSASVSASRCSGWCSSLHSGSASAAWRA
jgi:hypothetical protein